MIFAKGAHKSDCSGEISPNFYFDWLFLLKLYKISAKQGTEVLCLMTLKSGAKFEDLFQK